MINEIIKFENIGTQNYLVKLSNLINKGLYNRENINDFFVNKLIDGNTIFDGGLVVLEYIEFVDFSKDGLIHIPNKHQHFLRNHKLLTSKIVSLFFEKWKTDESFNKIFNHDTIYHDIDLAIVVDNAAFQFKYSKLKQFLIDFKVMDIHPYKESCFCIHNQYKRFFDKNILPEVRKQILSLKELERLQNLKNQHGEEAEIFVLNTERQKFYNHSLVDAIEQISHIDSSAGYDISSLKNDNSAKIDKFIEVKSYSGKPYFYWSANEIKIAEQEQENYFLYLINRDEMNNNNYEPMIIQNPYKNILNAKNWKKDCQSWQFNLLDEQDP